MKVFWYCAIYWKAGWESDDQFHVRRNARYGITFSPSLVQATATATQHVMSGKPEGDGWTLDNIDVKEMEPEVVQSLKAGFAEVP